MHAKLNRIHCRNEAQELGKRGFCIRHEVIRRQAPDQSGRWLLGGLIGTRHTTSLHAATVNMVPDSDSEFHTASMCHFNQAVESSEIAPLFLGRNAHHPHVGEAFHVEEVRVARCEKAAVLIAEDHDQGVKSILRQSIEVASPISLVIKPAFPVGTIHRVKGQRAGRDGWLLQGFAQFRQRGLS
jgi:hypothetical protein